MPERMPVVFVSHGAPDALLKAPDTLACWRDIGQNIPVPTSILVVSAHWEARHNTVSLSGAPETVHDFGGFSSALNRIRYPAPGAPALAERVVALLSASGLPVDIHPTRGLDHGAWVPLYAMFPQANVPVTQLALAQNGNAQSNYALGQMLAPLRDEGVLILASGAITHNFGWLDWHATGNQAPLPQARTFSDWVAGRLAVQDVPALLAYRLAPFGAESHPSEDHFLPLLVALGAACGDAPQRLQPSYTYGSLAMDAYVWRHAENTAPVE